MTEITKIIAKNQITNGGPSECILVNEVTIALTSPCLYSHFASGRE